VKLPSFFILTVLFVFFTCSVSQAENFLADRHGKRNVNCVGCHGTASPEKGTFVEMAACLKCHGTYDKVKERTKNLGKRNPHNNHVGELDCTVCHYGHSESVLYCAKCHTNLDLKAPK
jgi:hypothetical protein